MAAHFLNEWGPTSAPSPGNVNSSVGYFFGQTGTPDLCIARVKANSSREWTSAGWMGNEPNPWKLGCYARFDSVWRPHAMAGAVSWRMCKSDDGLAAPAPRYSVTAERTNGEQPVVATRLHMPSAAASGKSHTAESDFIYNFNPTSLQLPDKTWAVIMRTVANQSEPATTANPDFLTLSRVRSMGDAQGRGAIVIDPVNESSIIFRSTPGETYDDRGVQDPRVMRDPETGLYWLTASSIGSRYTGTVIANSRDGIRWTKVGRCDADHTNPLSSVRTDPIRNVSCNYGRAASILWREEGEHYMIWGAGTLNLARSVNRSLTDWVTVRAAWLAGLPERGAWVNPGGPPARLSDGNYLFLHVE